MSVHPRVCQVATSWPGNFVADSLVVPLEGASDVARTSCAGSLKGDLVSVVWATTVLVFTFAPQTLQTGVAVIPALEVGTGAFMDVAVDAIDTAAQTVAIRFRTAAGGPTSPPGLATGGKLHLAIFRPLPVR